MQSLDLVSGITELDNTSWVCILGIVSRITGLSNASDNSGFELAHSNARLASGLAETTSEKSFLDNSYLMGLKKVFKSCDNEKYYLTFEWWELKKFFNSHETEHLYYGS